MTTPTYAYNASAVGLGGVIHQGRKTTVVPSIASVCLASAGGEAYNSVDNYDRDDIAFTRAQTRVSGYATPIAGNLGARRFFTYADVLVSNLRIFDRIRIAFMQATVTSSRDVVSPDPFTELCPDQSRFNVRLFYHGVEIDGEEVAPDVDMELCHAGSYADTLRVLRGHPDLAPAIRQIVEEFDAPEAMDLDARNRRHKPAVNAPLVTVRGKGTGNRVDLRKFGRARFGELLIKPDRQRVSLLRLSLDSNWSPQRPLDFIEEPLPEPQVQSLQLAADTTTASSEQTTSDGDGDGGGGSLSSDGGSNGVPIWPVP